MCIQNPLPHQADQPPALSDVRVLATTLVGPVRLTIILASALYTYDLAYDTTLETGDLYDTLGEATDAATDGLRDLFESWRDDVTEVAGAARVVAGRA